jgi:phosphate transport system substrate-binding protein
MRRTLRIATAVGITVALASAIGLAGNAITIKGSDTMVILGQRWAEEYMASHKGAVLQVTGGGSGTGIAAMINGSADIAECSRPMTDKEKQEVEAKRGKKPVEIATALDGLAIYVNTSSPITKLSKTQIKGIFQGDIKNWKDVGGPDADIIMYSRENNSGTYAYFKEHVLQNEDFAPECQTLPGTASIINAVSKDPKSIGYGGIGYASGVKALLVSATDTTEAIEPTEANVDSGKYPLARYLYWYTLGEPTGDIKALVDWVLGPEGQKIVSAVGYYPLPKKASAANEKTKTAADQ